MNQAKTNTIVLSACQLAIGYANGKKSCAVLSDLNTSLQSGELACLFGANGSGKSTLIRTLAGVLPPLNGDILLQNKAIRSFHAVKLAQQLSIVLTDRIHAGNLSVSELVCIGRYPYTGWSGKLSARDKELVEWSIHKAGIEHLANRNMLELSDGERQKAMIARALAQDTPLMLLDEPTAHLDLHNRVSILFLLRNLAKETGKAILLSIHELESALQVADSIWLIDRHKKLHCGSPEDMVLNGLLKRIFENQPHGEAGGRFSFDMQSGSFKLMHIGHDREIALKGNGVAGHWTEQALSKEGYKVVKNKSKNLTVEVTDAPLQWIIRKNGSEYPVSTIKELIETLKNG